MIVEALRRWRRRFDGTESARWIVVDVESSGLDPARDELIAIGAVALVDGRVVPVDSFEVTLRQDSPSQADNIVVHGLGVAAQAAGTDPRAALQGFAGYARTSPVLAFHAPFDRKLIERATAAHLGAPFSARWLDLAALCPALFPDARLKSLDEWLDFFEISAPGRHDAAADAYATALLATRLIERARAQSLKGFGQLEQAARNVRWIR